MMNHSLDTSILCKGDIVTAEASFFGSKGSLLVQFGDFAIELVESGSQRAGDLIVLGCQSAPIRSQKAEIECGGAFSAGPSDSTSRWTAEKPRPRLVQHQDVRRVW
jgi:hypothetical protein